MAYHIGGNLANFEAKLEKVADYLKTTELISGSNIWEHP